MSLDQRSNAILAYLVQADSNVPIKELTEKFKISRRTVYYDIEKINSWLKDQKLPEVNYVRSVGFHLEEEARSQIPELIGTSAGVWHYEYSPDERKALIAIYLMAREAPIFLEDLMGKTRVSRNTTLEDVKGLKNELSRFGLELKSDRKSGYLILGDEDDKRKAIVFYLQQVLSDQKLQTIINQIPLLINQNREELNLFDFEKLKAVHGILVETEKELNVVFTDDFMQNLSLRLLLFGRRLAQGKRIEIDPVEKEVLKEASEFEAAKEIGAKLSRLFGVHFPEDEIFYLTKHLLSSRVQFSEARDENISPMLEQVADSMVTDFQKYACVFFEDINEIKKNLLLHIKPAYYRLKYGLEDQSDSAELIKDKYQVIFQLTKKVVHHLEEAAGNSANDNEVALIATHFGGWMRRVDAKPPERKTALLVCTKGLGTSKLLQHQLEGLFSTVDIYGSVSLREYEKNLIDADFIISTIPLEKSDKPVFVVSPILSDAEKEGLLKKVNALVDDSAPHQKRASAEILLDLIGQYADIHNRDALERELKRFLSAPVQKVATAEKPSLADILPVENILIREGASDWKHAIKLAAEPLLNKGSITRDYIKAMIDSLIKMGPYIVIAPKFAIPHARPEDGVNKLGMSLLKLDSSVDFSDKGTHPVNLILVLAATDGESHLKALGELTDLLGNQANIEEIIASESPKNIFELLTAHKV
ncbi:BglG family transcription antiterminator [Mesobacillus sp. AQ2]|uniref:BglG family transcription antiterminator n=1 Tax=Mesobacillus sp. AQ2 TaxID=3043332 RepID=UPI0024C1D051|nr:BglG family transcription antiterminator [Mesobacillus sp. AQ2]WHX40362.1 BglG family transcription antiterminator [Mesobacillus sp. AQ2]